MQGTSQTLSVTILRDKLDFPGCLVQCISVSQTFLLFFQNAILKNIFEKLLWMLHCCALLITVLCFYIFFWMNITYMKEDLGSDIVPLFPVDCDIEDCVCVDN